MSEQHVPIGPATQAGKAGAEELNRTHVLIVDDHAPSRLICAGFCDLFDHTSETARNAAEAVAAMKRCRFDVVVMNVHLPDMTGLETLTAIREISAPAASTPVIGLAPANRADEAQRWLAAGMRGLVAKPITASRLFAAIQSAMEPPEPGARSWAPAS